MVSYSFEFCRVFSNDFKVLSDSLEFLWTLNFFRILSYSSGFFSYFIGFFLTLSTFVEFSLRFSCIFSHSLIFNRILSDTLGFSCLFFKFLRILTVSRSRSLSNSFGLPRFLPDSLGVFRILSYSSVFYFGPIRSDSLGFFQIFNGIRKNL